MKICSTCKLPKEKFYKNKRRSDGLQTYCIDCAKTRSKKRYLDFSEEERNKIKERASQKRLRNKQFLWDYLKNNPCVVCGEADPIVLELDHITDKFENVSDLASQAVSLLKIKKEIAKCEVRCANCHRRKTAKQFGWYNNIVL